MSMHLIYICVYTNNFITYTNNTPPLENPAPIHTTRLTYTSTLPNVQTGLVPQYHHFDITG